MRFRNSVFTFEIILDESRSYVTSSHNCVMNVFRPSGMVYYAAEFQLTSNLRNKRPNTFTVFRRISISFKPSSLHRFTFHRVECTKRFKVTGC